jgi:hypothetical protein
LTPAPPDLRDIPLTLILSPKGRGEEKEELYPSLYLSGTLKGLPLLYELPRVWYGREEGEKGRSEYSEYKERETGLRFSMEWIRGNRVENVFNRLTPKIIVIL